MRMGKRCLKTMMKSGWWALAREKRNRSANYERHMGEIYRRYYRQYFGGNKNFRILEIGCSTGGMLQAIYRDGFRQLTGIDMCEANIKIAKRRNGNIRYLAGDGVDFKKIGRKSLILSVPERCLNIWKKDVMETVREMKKHCSNSGGID